MGGEVLVSSYELDDDELWTSIRKNFQAPSIPTWSNLNGTERGWTSSDYAMELCSKLETNKSEAFQKAHNTFDSLARQTFDLIPSLQAKCSFVTQYSVSTNENLTIHTDHPSVQHK